MTLDELTQLIHKADAKQLECAVVITTINIPDHSRGSMYGRVEYGRDQSKRVFNNEEELRELLERLSH